MDWLVDVHCHLDYPDFDESRERIISEAKEKGIIIVNSCCDLERLEMMLELAKKHSNLFVTIGFPPSQFVPENLSPTIELIKEHQDGIIGIGEIGLDYYWVRGEKEREIQRDCFIQLLDLAKDLSQPIVIHSRDTDAKILSLLHERKQKALLHCFSGTIEQTKQAIRDGHIISIPTNVCYIKSRQKLATQINLENIVLETDSPYLAPHPKAKNNPLNIITSAQKIAELKNTSLDEITQSTTKNAKRFFHPQLS